LSSLRCALSNRVIVSSRVSCVSNSVKPLVLVEQSKMNERNLDDSNLITFFIAKALIRLGVPINTLIIYPSFAIVRASSCSCSGTCLAKSFHTRTSIPPFFLPFAKEYLSLSALYSAVTFKVSWVSTMIWGVSKLLTTFFFSVSALMLCSTTCWISVSAPR